MVHPVQYGKRERMSYSRIDDVLEIPNLLGVQTDSFKWLIDEGLKEVFRDISPIEDFAGNLILEFVDYYVSEEKKYDFEEAKEKDTNYSAPLKVKVRLINTETGEVKEQEVFMGDLPLMSSTGTFVINGAERVVVSQLVRSPGAYYKEEFDKTGKQLYSSTLIPNRGAWLEFRNRRSRRGECAHRPHAEDSHYDFTPCHRRGKQYGNHPTYGRNGRALKGFRKRSNHQ